MNDIVRRGNDLNEFTCGRIFSLFFDAGWTYSKISDFLEISISTIKSHCQRIRNGESSGQSSRENCTGHCATSKREDCKDFNG